MVVPSRPPPGRGRHERPPAGTSELPTPMRPCPSCVASQAQLAQFVHVFGQGGCLAFRDHHVRGASFVPLMRSPQQARSGPVHEHRAHRAHRSSRSCRCRRRNGSRKGNVRLRCCRGRVRGLRACPTGCRRILTSPWLWSRPGHPLRAACSRFPRCSRSSSRRHSTGTSRLSRSLSSAAAASTCPADAQSAEPVR